MKQHLFEIWRYTQSYDNFSDPTWMQVGTFYASKQPFTGDESLRSNQMVQNVRDMLVSYDLNLDVKKDDELKYNGETVRIGFIEIMDSGVIPHLEIFTTESQWNR